MNESTIAEHVPGKTGPPQRNRLLIAHLLLWTATTALALSFCEPPRPASEIGFASFLYTPGTDVEAAKDRERQRIWRKWQNKYCMDLASAPIYGLALAGLVLAGWRTVTARFGFPVQPGHWLLVIIGGATALVAEQRRIQWSPLSPDGNMHLLVAIIAATTLVAAARVGNSAWRYPFVTVGGSFGVLSLGCISPSFPSPVHSMLFGIAVTGLAVALCLGVFSAVIDLAERYRWDIFHWLGVATLFGIVGHFTAIFLATRM